jgi:acyl phosphate:glycerol-3-phosphate acyltransferase
LIDQSTPQLINLVVYLIAAYASGALCFALWAGKAVRGIDLREHGSGNLGATNVLRNLGPFWGIVTLLLDMAKGWVAVAIFPLIFGIGSVADGSPWVVAGAVTAVLGHMFTPFASFKGGKGVATSLGIFVALAPWAALAGVVGFVITVAICRWVSLGSLVLSILFPVCAWFAGPPEPLRYFVVGLGVLLLLLVALRHRANWVRIAAGTESQFSWRRT